MNISEAKEQIKDTVEAYLERDDAGMYAIAASRQRPVFLLGAPGIGKTAIMEQIAQELGIGIVSYSMTHHTRQSALGLPRIVHREFEGFEYEASEYTMSEIVSAVYDYMETTGLRRGILFLDEINCVSETLYPSMLQFLQFKTFGRHRIPDDWAIVCAGNPPEYNKSVHEFDVVTLDRLREIAVEPEYAAFKPYASERGLHPAVTTFLEAKPDCFYLVQSKPGGGKSFVTARGWEDLAETISLYEKMGKKVGRELFAQFLRDDEICDQFSTYYTLFEKYRSDYQVGRILAGEADADIDKRAVAASFDERVALLGLLLDALATSCRAALEHEEVVVALRDELRAAKPKLLAGAGVGDTVAAAVRAREDELARRVAANTINALDTRKERLVCARLHEFVTACATRRTPEGPEAFHTLSLMYGEQVDKMDPLVAEASAKLDCAFAFIERTWGNKREMLVFLAELTTRPATTQFIAHYGNDAFYAHNDELQVDTHRQELSERVRALDLGAAAASDEVAMPLDPGISGGAAGIGNRRRVAGGSADGPGGGAGGGADGGADGGVERAKLAAYYSKEFEWGFASMSRMTLPIDKIKGKTVLDVCCRRGKGVYKFSAKIGNEGRVMGVDWSSSYIADAIDGMERSWRKNGLKANNMEFAVAYPEDLMDAGIGTGTMDVVYINNVMTLLYDQPRALSEFCRVLKPGGLLICETIFSSGPRDEDVVAAAREIGNSIQAGRTEDEFFEWARKAGFADIEVVDSFEVAPQTGFKMGREVEVVESDEDVSFSAVAVHAYKPGA